MFTFVTHSIFKCMNEKKRIIFVVNPISGTQNKKTVLSLLDTRLNKEKFEFEVLRTEGAGHAVEIANKAALNGTDIVVAIGGDGTINEIARALVHTNTVLGIIPCGSGNGLARHLEIPMDAKGAIDVINKGYTGCIDYGKINSHPFFCTCGVGFDAFVSLKFSKSGKRGLLAYLENTLHESLNYQPDTYEIESEDENMRYKAFLIACANASQYGNNAYIAPQASLNDGLMDVTILEPFTVLDIPTLAFQLFNRTIDQNSRIKTFKCKRMHIRRSHNGVIHYDGDPVMSGENIDVEIVANGLRVIVPENAKGEQNMIRKASDYFNGLKPIGDAIVEDITNKNKRLISRFRRRIDE